MNEQIELLKMNSNEFLNENCEKKKCYSAMSRISSWQIGNIPWSEQSITFDIADHNLDQTYRIRSSYSTGWQNSQLVSMNYTNV